MLRRFLPHKDTHDAERFQKYSLCQFYFLRNFVTKQNFMNENISLPVENEKPNEYAERLGTTYSHSTAQDEKKGKGQFFTPVPIAKFMAQRADCPLSDNIRILDPGCGIAVLSCSLIEVLSGKSINLRNIHLDLYDTDVKLIPYTETVLKYLQSWCAQKKIKLSYNLYSSDFVLDNSDAISDSDTLFRNKTDGYDYIISNPPYFKIPKNDKRTRVCSSIVDGQTNIYALFMAICSRMLKDSGQMIFITPRSFASGRYFQSFRNFLFSNVVLDFVHLFKTRKDTFAKDDVLQELIITSFRRVPGNGEIAISNSVGTSDLSNASVKTYESSDIVNVNSIEQVIYLPADNREDTILNLFRSWKGTLGKYGIKISTGPVVAFRAYDHIIQNETENSVPLLWMYNVVKMLADHPVEKKGKGQYIIINKETRPYLLPNKNYVLLRRFSSKDDNSRLIAAPYFGNMAKYELVGIENKLNYIHRPGGRLRRDEVIGISALLNSKIFDTYFRTFNGNINVSATELKMMPMPDLSIIQEIGRKIILHNDYSIDYINEILMEYFNI